LRSKGQGHWEVGTKM